MRSAARHFYFNICASLSTTRIQLSMKPGADALKTEEERQEGKRLRGITTVQIPFDLRCIITTSF